MATSRKGVWQTHGETLNRKASKEYTAWGHVVQRCTNPKHKNWNRYGGRGITICSEWLKFENFLADMGRAPSPLHTIDRVDNDAGYSKANCRWATRKEQSQNKRDVYRLCCDGDLVTLAAYCQAKGLSYPAICQRMHRHKLSPMEAVALGPT